MALPEDLEVGELALAIQQFLAELERGSATLGRLLGRGGDVA